MKKGACTEQGAGEKLNLESKKGDKKILDHFSKFFDKNKIPLEEGLPIMFLLDCITSHLTIKDLSYDKTEGTLKTAIVVPLNDEPRVDFIYTIISKLHNEL